VKKTPLLAVVAAALLALCFLELPGTAQTPGSARPPAAQSPSRFVGKTVLIDISYVFKKHARFTALMTQLKNDADAEDVKMKKEQAQWRSLAMSLQKYNPGSPEYKKMEEDIARMKTDLAIKMQQKQREFVMQEAKNYNETYKEIEDEVNYFCQSNGVAMVMRFTGDPVDETNPDNILSNINKPVVWYDKNLDITPYIYPRFAGPAATADKRSSPTGGNPAAGGYQPQRTAVPSFPANGTPR
jgi:Skp family chaperone for outer membrane proteins